MSSVSSFAIDWTLPNAAAGIAASELPRKRAYGIVRERTWRDARIERARMRRQLCLYFFCFPCSPTREPWVNTLALCRPSCPLARCDAYVYTALHICMCACMYKHVCNCRYAHEQCSRLRVRENDFTVWRNFKTSEGAAERAKKYGTT